MRGVCATRDLGELWAQYGDLAISSLSSQFFANAYLNELEQFVKHHLKCPHYVRYDDDFILLDNSKVSLEQCKFEIRTVFNLVLVA